MRIEPARPRSPFARRHAPPRRTGTEAGAVAIMTPFVLIVMIAMVGMAIDLSRSYNRKSELQSLADAVALTAASSLDGTSAGIDRAVAAAGQTAAGFTFAYHRRSVSWSSAALTFGMDANGGAKGWADAASARPDADRILFARVDTSALDPGHGNIDNFIMAILSSAFATTNVAASAVAGRDALNALPLAICANANTRAAALPSGELVEYGFRRGVSYDLMHLNPGGSAPEHFLLNPVAPPGTVGTTMKNRMDIVARYVCTGKMAIPTLAGGDVTVERGFPLSSLYVYLNTRFGTAVPPCDAKTAPADPVVKRFDLAAATWRKFRPAGQSANALASPAPLLTVAEQPAGATRTAYGPLWTYARAVRYTSYVANGGVEPVGGHATFGPSDWNALYSPGLPAAQSYPNTTPYQAAGGSTPYNPYQNVRVLNVPLLQCPVPAGARTSATVVGIAKFFMTVPASASAIHAEFAGMNTEAALGGNARLYR